MNQMFIRNVRKFMTVGFLMKHRGARSGRDGRAVPAEPSRLTRGQTGR